MWGQAVLICVLRTVSELSVCRGHVRVVERSVRNRKRAVRQHGRDFWTLGSQLQLTCAGFSIYRSTGLVWSQTRFKPQRHTSQKQVRLATHFKRRRASFQTQLNLILIAFQQNAVMRALVVLAVALLSGKLCFAFWLLTLLCSLIKVLASSVI